MKIYKTYRFKAVDPNPGKVSRLRAFATGLWRKGLNFCLEMAKQHRPEKSFELHRFVYRALRAFGFPAQLALDCRDKAFEAYQSHRRLKKQGGVWRRFPHFEGTPAIRFNIPRSCRLFTRRNQHWVELSMPWGPVRLRVAGRAATLRKVWESGASFAELVFREEDTFIHVAVPIRVRGPGAGKCRTVIGVDLNVLSHLVVAEARDLSGRILGTFFARAGYFNWKREQFFRLRHALQLKRNPGKLKAIKRRERDFVDTFLHTVTKRFIEWASQFPDPLIGLETLTGIRSKISASREWNRKLHAWPFRRGQDMVTYKGFLEGMPVQTLRGAFSSRYCSRCGGRNTRRSGATFRCLSCGYGLNVHLNGARNMSWRAFCYMQKAAGRADPVRDPSGVKGRGRAPWGPETASGQSGPEAGDNEGMRVAVLKNPLGRHSRALRKPPALAVG